ncbi:hypothetical protein BD779DRAFT_1473354 [Infundibulicybe gibba]|nr:hypothetical protein BD779DRAFT_1473354 [Infundibulicybe gibba]
MANHPPPLKKKKVARPVVKPPMIPSTFDIDEATTNDIVNEENESPAHLVNQDAETPSPDGIPFSQGSGEELELPVGRARMENAAKNTSRSDKGKEANIPSGSEDSEQERVKGTRKKQKKDKKGEVRRMVQAGRVAHEVAATNLKQKASDGNPSKIDGSKIGGNVDHDRPASKKSKCSQGGLRPEFVRTLAKSHANAVAAINTSNATNSRSSANNPTNALGGFSSDEDTVQERRTLGTGHAEPVHYYGGGSSEKETKVFSLIKVVPTTSTPELVSASGPRQRAQGQTKKEDITTKSLPLAYRGDFRSRFIPLMRQYTSTLGPWEAPPEADTIALFAAVFKLDAEALEPDLAPVVLKLVEDRLSDWRNKFATTAMTVLERHFNSLHLHTQEKRAEHGIFQSFLVSATLSTHYASTASVEKLEQMSDTRPVGALVLAVQAVKRSLLYWKDGVKNIPSGPTGYFSKNNWGDHVERHEGKNVTVKSTTAILKITAKLSEIQWDKIITAAEEHARPRKEIVTANHSTDSDDSSSD